MYGKNETIPCKHCFREIVRWEGKVWFHSERGDVHCDFSRKTCAEPKR